MRVRRRFAVVAIVTLLLAMGCGGDDDDSTSPKTSTTTSSTSTTSSSSTTSTSTTAFAGSTSPTSIASHATSTALLTDVRVDDGVVTLTFRADVPGVDARYVDPPITQDGSGATIAVKGRAFLHVRLEPASGVDLSKDPYEETYTGPDRLPGTGVITEVVKTGDFEANLGWVIGLDSQRAYRVEVDASTVRVYISR